MSKSYTQVLHALIWLCLSSVCYANCTQDSTLRAIVSDGYQPESDLLITCKLMPDSQQKTIVVFARETGFHNYTLTVLVVNNKTEKVLNRFIDEDPSFGSNGDPVKIEIDTARYVVAPNKRVFGVRVTHNLNSWDSTEDINLFLEDGNKLNRILKDLTINSSNSHGCDFDGHEMSRIISVSKSMSEGFYNLIIKTGEHIYEPRYSDNGECSSKEVSRTSEQTLHFKAGSYVIPDDFR